MIMNINNKSINLILVLMLFLISTFAVLIPTQNAFAETCKAKPRVRPNDTLEKIAQKYKISPKDLIQANKLVGPDYPIYNEQKLCIPKTTNKDTTWKVEPYMTHPAGNFKISIADTDNVLIKTTNFAPFSSYKVYMYPMTGKPLQAGTFVTGKNGNTSALIPIPFGKGRRNGPTNICIQDSLATVNLCSWFVGRPHNSLVH
jgi:LysM repeat protein